MAATPKRRRSKAKQRSTRGADRYDKLLTKFKKMKKFGGSFLSKSKTTKKLAPSHRVSDNNPEYNSVKVVN